MRRDSPGVTLVEVLLASVIGVSLVFVLYAALSGGQRVFKRGTDLSEAIVGALVVAETFQADCEAVSVKPDRAREPVQILQGGAGLQLPLADARRSDHAGVQTRSVTYGLAPGPVPGVSHFVREGRVYRNVFLRKLAYEFFSVPRDDPDMQYVRLTVTATDRTNAAEFALVRLKDLPLPSAMARAKAGPGEGSPPRRTPPTGEGGNP